MAERNARRKTLNLRAMAPSALKKELVYYR
jgi:hypothetical protein